MARSMTGTVVSINVSREKGMVKTPVPAARVLATGIENDAHAGPWHRQVSFLGQEQIRDLSRRTGRAFEPGQFAENLTVSGIDFGEVRMRDQFRVGGVLLEITQIGKECHSGCAIRQEVGQCIMPEQGVFTRVLSPGEIRTGDPVEHIPRPLRMWIITLSDRASRGEYEDLSGPVLRDRVVANLVQSRWRVAVEMSLLPDQAEPLRSTIDQALAQGADLIFTTGGTGIGPRDITVDVIRPMLHKEVPGIMDFIRIKYGAAHPAALLSRSVAGTIGTTLVFTLPGSVRAVKEYLEEILKVLEHAIFMAQGLDVHQSSDD